MLWPGGSSVSEGYPFQAEKEKPSLDQPFVWLIGEAFRVARGPHGEFRLSLLILEDDEDDILRPSC